MNPNFPNGRPPYPNQNNYQNRSSFNQVPLPGQSGFQMNRQSGYGYAPQPPPMMPQPGFQRQGTMGQPMGYPPMGQPQMGQPMGYPPMGQPQMGQPQMGYPPMGQPQMGRPPMGQPPMGQSRQSGFMSSPQMSGLHVYIRNILGKQSISFLFQKY